MKIDDVINKFDTTPVLFIGSGISRRYLNLPDWKGLLEHFAKIVNDDSFVYSSYESRAKKMNFKAGVMPKIAELIQEDFDSKWFSDKTIRTVEDEETLDQIRDYGLSPFKAEISAYIRRNTMISKEHEEEINKLIEISEKSISGIITTNYDTFLEDNFNGFKKYIGQTELIFSSIQGIAEIYKIHGSIEKPDSIVINEVDYEQFDRKSAYLAAKLMTIFMEYPIIFMGYSISDPNVQNIIKSILNCLDDKQIKLLEDRFIFVEYKRDMVGVEVTPFTIIVDDKPLSLKRITLSDFMHLYKALGNKKAKLPVRILRMFKQELYNYTIYNKPTANLRVAALDDNRVDDEELVLAIGKVSDLGIKGLSGIEGSEWYRNIIIEDLEFSADELLEYAFPNVYKHDSGRVPVNKYLYKATKEFPKCEEVAKKFTFDTIISNTIKKNRSCLGEYKSVKQIWTQEKHSLERATKLIAHLKEEQIDVDELEEVLREILEEDLNLLKNGEPVVRTNVRRLIFIYDYIKWGK